MNPAEVSRMLANFADHAQFCRDSLSIRDKSGQVVPLVLTPGQLRLAAMSREAERAGRPVRIVVLKARQVHMSVGACSLIWKRAAFLPGQQAMLVGNTHQTTSNLWGYCQQFTESYRGELARNQTVRTRRASATSAGAIDFHGESWIRTGTAGNLDLGRSFSFRHLLLSEYAYYPNAAELMTGLLQSVPDDPDTAIIVESSGHGLGGPFYELYMRACDPNTRGDWRALFFAWWEMPEYRRAVDGDAAAFQRSLERDELELVSQHGIGLEQLRWRRWALENKCEGSLDRFHQEYPATPEEAFLTSGRSRFDTAAIMRQPVVRDYAAGDLERRRVGTREMVQFVQREDLRGALRIWRRPEPGHTYVIGADPSKGRDPGAEQGKSDPDYSVAVVVDAQSNEQVATLRERLAPVEFARYLVDLAIWYNMAYVVPEANETGFVDALMQSQWPLDRLYWRRRDPSDRSPARLQDVGWLTTTTSKLQLISALDGALRDMSVTVRDPVIVQELLRYVVDSRGATNATQGSHDDCVIALALAVVGLGAAVLAMPQIHGAMRPAPEAQAYRSFR